jgi:hypothetical protein
VRFLEFPSVSASGSDREREISASWPRVRFIGSASTPYFLNAIAALVSSMVRPDIMSVTLASWANGIEAGRDRATAIARAESFVVILIVGSRQNSLCWVDHG